MTISHLLQATKGVCNDKKPGMLDMVGGAKWKAWSSLGQMSMVSLYLHNTVCHPILSFIVLSHYYYFIFYYIILSLHPFYTQYCFTYYYIILSYPQYNSQGNHNLIHLSIFYYI